MLHHTRFLVPALVLALGAAACGGDGGADDEPDAALEADEMGFDQVDQVPIDPALDTDGDGMRDAEEGLSVEAPDTGMAAVNEVPVPAPPR